MEPAAPAAVDAATSRGSSVEGGVFGLAAALQVRLPEARIEAGMSVDAATLAAALGRDEADRAAVEAALRALPRVGGVMGVEELPSALRASGTQEDGNPLPEQEGSSLGGGARAGRRHKRAASREVGATGVPETAQPHGGKRPTPGERPTPSDVENTCNGSAAPPAANHGSKGQRLVDQQGVITARTCPLCGEELANAEAMEIHVQFECTLVSDSS